jgi:hypothetical protein
VSETTPTQQLGELLRTTQSEVAELLDRLGSTTVDPVELVGLLESLALLDQERAEILNEIRNEASDTRRRQEERSLRQFVLRALDEIGFPQTAGFVGDYIYARERVVLKTRGFAALRRDENRAWRRNPQGRVAYVVPCLTKDGQAAPRWMARSDWELSGRVLVAEVERLWQWRGVRALLDAWRQEDDEPARSLYVPLLERYGLEALDSDREESARVRDDLLGFLEAQADSEIKRLERELGPPRAKAARRLEKLEAEEQLWGATRRQASIRGGDRRTSNGEERRAD